MQSPVRSLIHDKAVELTEAFRKGQYETILALTYPKLTELMGGREKMLSVLKQAVDELNHGTIRVTSTEIGEVSEPVSGGDKLFCVVFENLHLALPNGTGESPGYLLAISVDQGKTWTFLDGAGLTPEAVKLVCPDLPATLKLPEKKQPKFMPGS